MTSMSTCLVVLLLGAIVFMECQAQTGILEANEAEQQICEDNSNGRTVVSAKKDRRLSCTVVCDYEDANGNTDREMYNSPNGQQCCDVGGGMPTGCCKDGSCPVGRLGNCQRQVPPMPTGLPM